MLEKGMSRVFLFGFFLSSSIVDYHFWGYALHVPMCVCVFHWKSVESNTYTLNSCTFYWKKREEEHCFHCFCDNFADTSIKHTVDCLSGIVLELLFASYSRATRDSISQYQIWLRSVKSLSQRFFQISVKMKFVIVFAVVSIWVSHIYCASIEPQPTSIIEACIWLMWYFELYAEYLAELFDWF